MQKTPKKIIMSIFLQKNAPHTQSAGFLGRLIARNFWVPIHVLGIFCVLFLGYGGHLVEFWDFIDFLTVSRYPTFGPLYDSL